jgi:hypothetical protein
MPALAGPASGRTSVFLNPASFAATVEVGAGVVECVAELDQHVQRHQQPEGILATRAVDQVLGDDVSPPSGRAS